MSRFADATATKRFVLGDCECPGKPHDEDFVDFRSELGIADQLRIAEIGTDMGTFMVLCSGWNLLDNDGTAAPVDEEHVGRLFSDNFDNLAAWMTKNLRGQTLPNVSGAHSANGSRASASATRTTRKRR